MNKIIFVSDFFVEQYKGGAELTTEALIESSPFEVVKINSANLTEKEIEKYKSYEWIVCNFSQIENPIKVNLCKNVVYSIIEYDYKFCTFRSVEKHKEIKGNDCNCIEQGITGKINKAFYGYAKRIWFMSVTQKNIFLQNVATIREEKCGVLSSVFKEGDLNFIESIKDNEKGLNYLIIGSNSWIKGTQEAIDFAKENKLNFELVSGIPYHELLVKMSTSKGLIFRPLGGDTCPRIVIEAKLLGCELLLNDFVQHKDEEWFANGVESCFQYLRSNKQVFWNFYA